MPNKVVVANDVTKHFANLRTGIAIKYTTAMKTKHTHFSEIGTRHANQDVCRIVEMPEHDRTLFVLCDGMGGHAMGDVAAETVCNAICNYWIENPTLPDSDTKVIEACAGAWKALFERSCVFPPIETGTTLVMASIEGSTATIAHCGDSRCYLLREGNVLHQTKDHTDSSMFSERVTKCFFSMVRSVSVPEVIRIDVKPGDRVFLCTDGVYKAIVPQILTATLQDKGKLSDVVDTVKSMCEQFSTDNYSGILVEVG